MYITAPLSSTKQTHRVHFINKGLQGLLKRAVSIMGSLKTWSTKEEVLRDLAKASGRRIRNLNEEYLVVGDGPPPIIAEDEDFEMQLMFGEAAASRKSMTMGNESPDLLGIQQMLQMVKDYSDEEEDTPTEANCSDHVISITKVSNLNPFVQEFIPKSAQLHSQTSHSNDINGSINQNIVTQATDEKTQVSIEKDTNVERDDNSKDVNSVKADDYNEIATKLKNKISDAAKSDSFELKKQKNVAIATLLRLYANNKSPNNENDHSIKLIKPDFFKSSHPVSSTSSTSPEPKEIAAPIPMCSSASLNSIPSQATSDKNSNGSKTTKPKIKVDPEMKLSIEKVSKWLDVPTEQTSQPVYLGPIAFKRKEVTPSPTPPVSDTKRNETNRGRITFNDSQRFKPSKYASDLANKYMERSRVIEDKKKEITWSNLETVLKEKDLLAKKRWMASQSSNSTSE